MTDISNSGNYIHHTELPLRMGYFSAVDDVIYDDRYKKACMVTIDIKNFHYYNRWYGREKGDSLLNSISEYLADLSDGTDVIAGYLGGDNFSAFFPYSGIIINNILDNVQDIVREYAPGELAIIPIYGAYKIIEEDRKEKITAADVYDYTTLALKQIQKESMCWFDSSTIRKREEELHMLPEILKAMDNDEFTFFLQPKCHMKTGKIIGAEALVRWISPEKGMISPGIFIPLLENHGLVSRLDLIVWEKVCAKIREWMDAGHNVLPISVNVSRIDIAQLDVALTFEHLIQKYDLTPNKIEIEITESAYTDDDKLVIETVNKLHRVGFKVLIDDFGSGYSSLNLLKEIQADVLKLDMKFLESNAENEDKSFSIIESILEMSRELHIPAIIEGVEDSKQIDMLEELGCEFAQGYFYYRPMHHDEYGKMLSDENLMCTSSGNMTVDEKSHLKQLYDYFIKVASVNVNDGKYVFLKADSLHRQVNVPEAETITAYANRFIERGLIKSDDTDQYLKLMNMDSLKEKIRIGKRYFIHSLRYFYDNKIKWVMFEITVPENYDEITSPHVLYTWKEVSGQISRSDDYLYLLSTVFHKILKVNLLTHSFDVVNIHDDKELAGKEYSEDIQEWMTNFAKSGKVHKDDVEEFIKFADIKKIYTHFKRSDKPINVKYRRLMKKNYVPVEMTLCKSSDYSEQNPIIVLHIK